MKYQTATGLVLWCGWCPSLIAIPSAYFTTETVLIIVRAQKKIFCGQIWPVDQQIYLSPTSLFIFGIGSWAQWSPWPYAIPGSPGNKFKAVPGFPDGADPGSDCACRKSGPGAHVHPHCVRAVLRRLLRPSSCGTSSPQCLWGETSHGLLCGRVRCMSNSMINTVCFVTVKNNTIKYFKKIMLLHWKLLTTAVSPVGILTSKPRGCLPQKRWTASGWNNSRTGPLGPWQVMLKPTLSTKDSRSATGQKEMDKYVSAVFGSSESLKLVWLLHYQWLTFNEHLICAKCRHWWNLYQLTIFDWHKEIGIKPKNKQTKRDIVWNSGFSRREPE